jgi:hypothetical protein
MRKLIIESITKAELWVLRINEVARFEGIILADLHTPSNRPQQFRDILLDALRLLKATDSRRFERVRTRLAWIVHQTLERRGMAEYRHRTRTCAIDFLEPSPERDREHLIGWYACTLVHEATHGQIRSRGILYTPQLRLRIERLCVREEQRFLTHLTFTHPDLAEWLYQEFDASQWDEAWRATPREQFLARMKRIFRACKAPDQEDR